MIHYIYRITNILNNKHYYGVRSCIIEPKQDLGYRYFSSSSDEGFLKEQKAHPERFKYKVIKTFKDRNSALQWEIKLHNKFNVKIHPSFYNKANQTIYGFDVTGCKQSPEHIKNKTESQKITKNTPEYKQFQANLTTEQWSKLTTEERKIIGEKISKSLKGKPQPKWKSEQHSKRMSGFGNSRAKVINIYDGNGNIKFVCKGNFKKICDQYNLPHRQLRLSHNNNGTPIIQTPRSLKMAKSKGWESYVGWYATEDK